MPQNPSHASSSSSPSSSSSSSSLASMRPTRGLWRGVGFSSSRAAMACEIMLGIEAASAGTTSVFEPWASLPKALTYSEASVRRTAVSPYLGCSSSDRATIRMALALALACSSVRSLSAWAAAHTALALPSAKLTGRARGGDGMSRPADPDQWVRGSSGSRVLICCRSASESSTRACFSPSARLICACAWHHPTQAVAAPSAQGYSLRHTGL
eukprot:scaffold50225_cov57-Phaeocystis_antarctica.AAC.2